MSEHKYLLQVVNGAAKEPVGWMWWCPACQEYHGGATNGTWTFDGNHEAPTFNPSFLVRATIDPVAGKFPEGVCDNTIQGACHTFVRNGQIQYLGDCTHAMAGQTVPMVAIKQAPY